MEIVQIPMNSNDILWNGSRYVIQKFIFHSICANFIVIVNFIGSLSKSNREEATGIRRNKSDFASLFVARGWYERNSLSKCFFVFSTVSLMRFEYLCVFQRCSATAAPFSKTNTLRASKSSSASEEGKKKQIPTI